MGPTAIETTGLTKSYGEIIAVDRLNLCIQAGEIYAFLGLNGAGKTTTIRALLGMVRPDNGSVRMLGQSVGRAGQGPWEKVGHLVERPAAYPELTVTENLEVSRRLYRIRDASATRRAIDRLDLGDEAGRKAASLSTGNLQRLALARALLHEPEVLILDEPANGLDPAGVVEIRHLLMRLARSSGTTVFMSSHILAEVDRLADRIGIIHHGRLLEEVDARAISRSRVLRVEARPQTLSLAQGALGRAGLAASFDEKGASIALKDERVLEAPDEVASLLVGAGAPPTRLAVEQESLEDHFLRLTGGVL
jgi:ABC-2 type transport system ATP-binding protein